MNIYRDCRNGRLVTVERVGTVLEGKFETVDCETGERRIHPGQDQLILVRETD